MAELGKKLLLRAWGLGGKQSEEVYTPAPEKLLFQNVKEGLQELKATPKRSFVGFGLFTWGLE